MFEIAGETDRAVLVEPGVQVAGDLDLGAGELDHHLGELHHAIVLPTVGSHVEAILDVVLGLLADMAVGEDVEINLQRGEAASRRCRR